MTFSGKMKRMHKVIIGVVVCLVILVPSLLRYLRYSVDYERGLSSLVNAIESSDRIYVLEGLPHPTWEEAVFEKELEKPHISHHKHLFYEGEVTLSAFDREALETLFIDGKLRKSSWDVSKKCGGFHPDFRVAWVSHGSSEAEAHFCFGCTEVRFYSDSFSCKADMTPEVEDYLSELWWPYRNQRPKPKIGEQGAEPNRVAE